jgi:PAS domain S-box-containing protein
MSSVSFVTDANGERIGVVAVNRDITHYKWAEEALRESEERYRNITEVISDYAFSYRVNPDQSLSREWLTMGSFTRITGFTIEEVESRGTFSLYHPEDSELAREHMSKVFQGEAVRGEYRLITKGGELRWLDVYRQPVWDERQNRVVRYFGVAQDITERKRIEQEKLEAERIRAELESEKELLKLKERFISVVSHEFRTPLSVIMSSGELVQRYYDRMTPEKQLDHIREIIAQSGYMTGLLDDILTFNKASAGKLAFTPAPLDLEMFCRTAIERIKTTDKGNHQINFITDSDLQKTPLDQKLLQHIVLNLLSNAVKYSPEGGEVRLELSRRDDEIILRVSDQGIGIPPESRVRLFEPFHRADNVGNISGTGLGLAIVKQSVDLHRGRIECKSEPGVGTTFTVYLPLIDRQAE